MSRPYPCVYCTDDGYCKKFSDEEVVSWCVLGPCKDEKPSHADRIRAMTDEELADYFAKFETKCYKRFFPDVTCDTKRFAEQHYEWLTASADGGRR